MPNRYGRLAARVYDADKPVRRCFGDVEFYVGALQGISGPILEPAVGNGRMLVPLLKAGFNVHGFDVSPHMLESCRRNCEASGYSAPVWQDEFENFQLPQQSQHAIIVPAGSFQLLIEQSAALRTLERFRTALRVGGRLIVDLGVPAHIRQQRQRVRSWALKDDNETLILVEAPVGRDDADQVAYWQHRYERWRDGRLLESEVESFALRWWKVDQFALALTRAGFSEIVVHGDY